MTATRQEWIWHKTEVVHEHWAEYNSKKYYYKHLKNMTKAWIRMQQDMHGLTSMELVLANQ